MRKIRCTLILLVIFPGYSFSQNVGIGTSIPVEKLHVAGNIKTDSIKLNAIKLTPNAGSGKLLTSDAIGNASWQTNKASAAGNIGFGVWGDCATNGNISEYNPVVDITGATNDFFGYSVSISGNYAIVGAYWDDVGANVNQGSASIYQYNGTSWILMQKIFDPAGAGGDFFGNSVSISGNYAIVGAYGDDIGANVAQGSAIIYQYNGSSWIFMQKLSDVAGSTNDYFGNSVSITGNYAIVGAYNDDAGLISNQGSASIYQYNAGTWALMQKITDPTGAANDFFGYSVSISGNFAIVGAYQDDVGGISNQGSASMYQYSAGNWVFMQQLIDATGATNDLFGNSVSISGNYAIVGAFNDDVVANPDQGSASIYQYNGTLWVLMQKLTDPAGAVSDYFGWSVFISGNYAIVGAYGDDIGANTYQGSASIYLRVGNAWGKLQYISDPMGNQNDYFGVATSIDGTTQQFLVGVYGYANSTGKVVFGKVN